MSVTVLFAALQQLSNPVVCGYITDLAKASKTVGATEAKPLPSQSALRYVMASIFLALGGVELSNIPFSVDQMEQDDILVLGESLKYLSRDFVTNAYQMYYARRKCYQKTLRQLLRSLNKAPLTDAGLIKQNLESLKNTQRFLGLA